MDIILTEALQQFIRVTKEREGGRGTILHEIKAFSVAFARRLGMKARIKLKLFLPYQSLFLQLAVSTV